MIRGRRTKTGTEWGKRMLSMWRDTAAMPEYGRLEGDVRTDVLVIGGGMAGILCAHFLRQAGVDCVLAEADR